MRQNDTLTGLAYDYDYVQYIVEFNRLTGNATLGPSLGDADVSGWYESLEYVNSLNSLVVSHTNTPGRAITSDIYKLNSTDGSIDHLASTGRDNDFAVYDSIHDIFYTTDPNGVQQFVHVNLTNGSATNLGGVPFYLGDLAFNEADGLIYGTDYYVNDSTYYLYSINTSNGGSPISVNELASVSGIQFRGIAFAPETPIPEPATVLLLGSGLVGLAGFRRKFRK